MTTLRWLVLVLFVPFMLAACSPGTRQEGQPSPGPKVEKETKPVAPCDLEADVRAALAKLSPEDRQVAEAQKFCVVLSENRLGEMGPPVKVMVKDQPVFLCCKGCQKKALADPDKTLAKVAELKSKTATPER